VLSNLKNVFRPKSIPQALALLEKNSGSILIIAGGTKLLQTKNNIVQELVDITGLELNYMNDEDGLTRIGATTPLQKLVESQKSKNLANGIVSQAAQLSHRSKMIRNVSTLGGELVTTSSLSTLYCALLVLQAQVRIAGGEEFALAMNIFLNKKNLGGGLLVEVIIPAMEPQTYAALAPVFHTGKPLLCACVRISLSKRKCQIAKIAITSTERVPQRLHTIEEYLEGKPFTPAIIETAADKAAEQFIPISDSLASKEYRKEVSRSAVKKALLKCLDHAESAI